MSLATYHKFDILHCSLIKADTMQAACSSVSRQLVILNVSTQLFSWESAATISCATSIVTFSWSMLMISGGRVRKRKGEKQEAPTTIALCHCPLLSPAERGWGHTDRRFAFICVWFFRVVCGCKLQSAGCTAWKRKVFRWCVRNTTNNYTYNGDSHTHLDISFVRFPASSPSILNKSSWLSSSSNAIVVAARVVLVCGDDVNFVGSNV